jgi:hypothetical protein
MKMLSAKMNKERRFNKHFASCLIINKNGKTELIAPKQMDDNLCQQSEMDSDEEPLKNTKNEGNQSISEILEEIRITDQTICELEQMNHIEEDTDKLGLTVSEMEQIKHIDEDTDKLGLTVSEMEQKPEVVNYHEIKLTLTSETVDPNVKSLKSETISQIGEKYLTSQTMEDSNSEDRLGCHDQESQRQAQAQHQDQAEIKVNDINKETKSNTILKGHKYKTDSKENEVKIKIEDSKEHKKEIGVIIETGDSKIHKKEMVTKKGLRVMDTNSNNCNFNIKDLSLNNSNSANGFQIKNENNKTMMINTNSNDFNLNKKESSLKKSNSTFVFQMKNENNKVIDRVSDLRKIRRPSKVSKCSN